MKVGNKMKSVILTIDRKEKKMSLGVKQLNQDPWTNKKLLVNFLKFQLKFLKELLYFHPL